MGIVAASLAAIIAYDLRVNSLTNPQMVPNQAPRFSWKLKAADKNAKDLRQTGFELIVASTLKHATDGHGDVWVINAKADSSQAVRYQGKPLEPGQQYFWRLKVTDQSDHSSDWSPVQTFRTEIPEKDFKGKWIKGFKPNPVKDPLDQAEWIWTSNQGNETPAETQSFAFEFEVKKGETARFVGTVDDSFVLNLNGKKIAEQGGQDSWRKPMVKSLDELKEGKNQLEIVATNTSKGWAGVLAAIEITGKDGVKTLTSGDKWTSKGKAVAVLGKNGMHPWNPVRINPVVTAPAAYFNKDWTPRAKIASALWYGTACGIVDFTVNGKRITEDLYTPGWTDYRKRIYTVTHDVTKQLKRGKNELGAILGQGWYAGYIAWGGQREHYGDTPMVRGFLTVTYEDGSKEVVETDESWMVGTGPITDEHFLHGEHFDARIQPANWKPASVGQPYVGKLEPFPGDPVKVYQTIKPISIKPLDGDKYLVDFGQNLTGFVKLKGSFKPGQTVKIRHGERLDANGDLYTANLRLAKAIDVFTAKGQGVEEWTPRFTFHGFQYVEVEGMDPKDIKALAISSATPEVGQLETSDPTLNKLIKNAWWTQKMNFVEVPTDCPQRDERLGWTGDAQVYVRTATYFSDVEAFFNKWLITLDDAQRADGQYPMVAPVLKTLEDGGPAWADAGVVCPMTIYQTYGDKELLRRHYPQIKRFIAFCKDRSRPNLLPPEKYHLFGDWLSINADTPKDVITTAYFAHSTLLTAEIAAILGEKADEKEYRALHAKLKDIFAKTFIKPDGKVEGETQCAYVLALENDLVPEELKAKTIEHFIKKIEERDWHLSTGFVGTKDLMNVLSKIGRNDVAFRLLHNDTFPSWIFPVKNGATSIWERWDGWTPEKGFQDVGMNSFAHYAYGAVVGWMFEKIGGIKEITPGYETILIAPQIDPNLTHSKCSYESVRGLIQSNWSISDKKLTLTVTVPPNCKAEIHVPNQAGAPTKHTVGSGTYTYQSSWN